MADKQSTAVVNNASLFDLKYAEVELIQEVRPARMVSMSIVALESIRTRHSALPASKNGLEAICGASCETGAQ